MFTFSNQPQFLDCVDNREMSVKMKVSGLLRLFAKFLKNPVEQIRLRLIMTYS